jgi:hypothetical protein
MTIKALIFLSIIVIILSCCQSSIMTKEMLQFKQYKDSIPTISLPLRLNCDNNIEPIKTSISNTTVRKFGGEKMLVYGKLAETKVYTAILYIVTLDESIPILKISNNSGVEISKLTLLKECGGNETCYFGTSSAEITSDLQIIIRDSVRTCKLDTLDNIIKGSENINTVTSRYTINRNGEILKNEK